MANLFCQQCATEIKATTRRCPVCGNKITPSNVKEEVRPDVVDDRFEVRKDFVNPHDDRRQEKGKRFEVKEPVVFTDKPKDTSTRYVSQLPKELIDLLKKYDMYSDQAIMYFVISLFIPWVGILLILVARTENVGSKKAPLYGTIAGFIIWAILSLV